MFKSNYEIAVNNATKSTLADQDWQLSLHVIDLINNKTHKDSPKTPSAVLEPIKKRFNDKRTQVKFLTIQLIDIIVKNCNEIGFNAIFGSEFVNEIAISIKEV